MYDVIVVGGGASGLMAAAQSSSLGKKTLLLEKNSSLGAKLKISGGGRCNITNAEYNIHVLLKKFGVAAKFLYTPFSQFGVEDTFAFFTSHGLPLVIEENGRTFPVSQKAADVVATFSHMLQKNHVDIQLGSAVKALKYTNNQITGVVTNNGFISGKSIILSTGGISHPETGSTGDGFTWLKALGHTIKDPTLTIVPLAVKEKWVKVLPGVTLDTMKITFFMNNKKQFAKTGSLLFTHFGISGPLILNSASNVSDLMQEGQVTAHIDMFPEVEINLLDERILAVFNANRNKKLFSILKMIAPPGVAKALPFLLRDINFDATIHSITREERRKITHILKAAPITITGLLGKDKAVAADGGIALTEVNMKTMQSKIFENLYLTGDLLHINRPSGGYSLQLCWTTGYIAGSNA